MYDEALTAINDTNWHRIALVFFTRSTGRVQICVERTLRTTATGNLEADGTGHPFLSAKPPQQLSVQRPDRRGANLRQALTAAEVMTAMNGPW